jgi:hypothetical protein
MPSRRPGKSGDADEDGAQPPALAATKSGDLTPNRTPNEPGSPGQDRSEDGVPSSPPQENMSPSSSPSGKKKKKKKKKTHSSSGHAREDPNGGEREAAAATPPFAPILGATNPQDSEAGAPAAGTAARIARGSDHHRGSEKPGATYVPSAFDDSKKKEAMACPSTPARAPVDDSSGHDSDEDPGAHRIYSDRKKRATTTERAVSRSSMSDHSAAASERAGAQGMDAAPVQNDPAEVVTAWVVTSADIEEQRADPDKNRPEDARKGLSGWILRHKVLTSLMIAVLVLAVVVALAVVLPSDPDPTPAPAPTSPPVSTRFMEVVQIIEVQTQAPLDIDNLLPHQREALTWLADNDTMAMDLQTVDPIIVAQRYALAATYFATGGWPETKCLPFMSTFDHCEWQVASNDDCYINDDFVDEVLEPYDSNDGDIGVSCDDNGYVTSLFLGK